MESFDFAPRVTGGVEIEPAEISSQALRQDCLSYDPGLAAPMLAATALSGEVGIVRQHLGRYQPPSGQGICMQTRWA